MIVPASPGRSIPVFSRRPNCLKIFDNNDPLPSRRPTSINTGLQEFWAPCTKFWEPCPRTVGTVDSSVIYQLVSRTVKGLSSSDNYLFFQSGCHSDDLKGRTRFIGIIKAGISPHPVQTDPVFLCLLMSDGILCLCFKFKRLVQIKFRHIDTGIEFLRSEDSSERMETLCLPVFLPSPFVPPAVHIPGCLASRLIRRSLPCYRFLSFFSHYHVSSTPLASVTVRILPDFLPLRFPHILLPSPMIP